MEEVLNAAPGGKPTEPWYDIAKDRKRWQDLQNGWKLQRIEQEQGDTQASRNEWWQTVAEHFESQEVVNTVWAGVRPPTGDGTPLEFATMKWKQTVVMAAAVAPQRLPAACLA